MTKSLQNFLKIAISLALGIAIIWLLYRKTDFKELMSIVRESNLSIILFFARIWFVWSYCSFVTLGRFF